MRPSQPNSQTAPVLIVDDDAGQRSLVEAFLRGQGFPTRTAASGEEALRALSHTEVRMIISDVRMPGLSGLEMLQRVRQTHAGLPVLLVTAFPDIRDAVGAMRDGAVNYLQKPIDLDELLSSVQKALGLAESASVMVENKRMPEGVIANGPWMRSVFRDAALVAPSDSRVLITGESGSGKEVVADVIHQWSGRAAGPLIKVNCAAIPETLLESELFGHEKGAFTGAQSSRIGRFEEAEDGTILLDEIAELSPHVQAKLLRITQDGRFQRLGSNKDRQTNARLLAATNRDLEKEVQAGRFREDLFYRLNVMEIYVPPLRDRPEDILPMASLFVSQFSGKNPRFAPNVIRCLELYPWPGNVRELRNAMERASLLCHGELILPEHLPARVRPQSAETAQEEINPAHRLEEVERQTILQTLREHRFNRTETAKALGISRRSLTYKVQRLKELGYQVDPGIEIS